MKSLDPFRFLLIAVSGWMNQRLLQLIDYLREENALRREPLGQRRLRFNNDQRRQLGREGKGIGKQPFSERWLQLSRPSRPRPCWPGIAG